MSSGKAANIRIENVERLDPAEIDRMINEAQTYKAADEAALARAEARRGLEAYVYRVRGLLRDKQLRGKMDEEDAETVRTALDNADAWADREDEAGADLLDLKLDELKGEISPVLERYGVSAEEGGAGGPGPTTISASLATRRVVGEPNHVREVSGERSRCCSR